MHRKTEMSLQERADLDAVCRLVAEGKRVTDPGLRRRIRQRSEAIQQQVVEKSGVVEWAIDLIRETREE